MNISCELNNSNFNEFVLEKIQDKLERKDVDKISRACLFLVSEIREMEHFDVSSCDITDMFKEMILYKDEVDHS